MERTLSVHGEAGNYVYRAAVSAIRPAQDYTARIMPYADGVATPLEEARIIWQR
jgi:starch phosphorylase